MSPIPFPLSGNGDSAMEVAMERQFRHLGTQKAWGVAISGTIYSLCFLITKYAFLTIMISTQKFLVNFRAF